MTVGINRDGERLGSPRTVMLQPAQSASSRGMASRSHKGNTEPLKALLDKSRTRLASTLCAWKEEFWLLVGNRLDRTNDTAPSKFSNGNEVEDVVVADILGRVSKSILHLNAFAHFVALPGEVGH